ncbi:predicted protein [Histoplasma capsulatum G186AR]|uniref:Myb/SANT-like domain-containing protein n=1 Tax=Ajellomyces capsulatus (strain G186AR / H82 / ATCC MYA-2454 / RMSCC 2432) TaxID=447093 RepID=C0NKJ4_AJECG|nr:uncharacterized protein HCBG_03674 [Histoplasma capsulatum G186AR]EEH08385.1 predicted protein [Histoplasma capsulatum G186AR]
MDLDESQIDPTSQYLDEPLISESQRPDSPMLATRATQRASPPYTQRARRGPRVQTDWTPDMELAMLNTFIDAKKQGLETDNSNYKSVVWPSIVDAVKSLGAAYQSSASSSQSPARMSTETSTRNQPLKRKFGDSIDALREVIRESATAKLRVEQPDDIKQATRLFLKEQ